MRPETREVKSWKLTRHKDGDYAYSQEGAVDLRGTYYLDAGHERKSLLALISI